MIGGRTALGVVAHPPGSGMRVRQSLVGRTAGPQRTIMESRSGDGFRGVRPGRDRSASTPQLQRHNAGTRVALAARRPSRLVLCRSASLRGQRITVSPGSEPCPCLSGPSALANHRQSPTRQEPPVGQGAPGSRPCGSAHPPLVHWGERGGRWRLWRTESILGRTKSSGTPDEWPRSPAASGGSAFSGRVAFGGPIPVVPAPSIPRR
jgi:hypothetical protein